MSLFRTTIRRSATSFIAGIYLLGFSSINLPMAVSAQEVPPPTCPVVYGTLAPTGADAHTYTFRPAGSPSPECVWENAYYIWDPVTKLYTPKYDTYVCDPNTGVCENVEWFYNATTGQYDEQRTVVYVPPAPSLTSDQGDVGTGATSQSTGSSIVSDNGTDSSNTIAGTSNTDAEIDLVNNVSVLMTVDSDATSGDASALFNTTVGDVGTGDAAAIANILNMIQSTWDPAYGDITLFSANLFANYYGDLLFDPSIVLGNGTNSTNNITNNTDNDLTVNVSNDASIENNINLDATSGDAAANGNTTVGDVSTGDAEAIANVINMINSAINAGSSFIGSLNLYGDLNGDILLPQWLAEIVLGNGTDSDNTITSNSTTDVDAGINNDYSITNNTDLNASSGDAEANNNTTVGNIGTGTAETTVNQMNLIDQNVESTHGLLVFVNVLGSWIGMLFGGAGTSAISAGNGTDSSNTITNNTNTDLDLNVDNDYSITNNLNLNANSGNATANANTNVGNVSTGDASASANILNMINSTMNFTDWFGVLFINVFGNWNGSFGVDTASGESSGTPATQTATGGSGGGGTVAATTNTAAAKVLAFVSSDTSGQGGSSSTQAAENTNNALAADSDSSTPTAPTVQVGNIPRTTSVWWITGVAGLFSLLLLGGERVLLLIRKP